MDEPREREIKLDLDPADWPALKAHALLGPLVRGRPSRLVSVYFDTKDQRLNHFGLSLRIRTVRDRFVQTVKSSEGAMAGLFDRPEWEEQVAGPAVDLAAIRATPAGALLGPGRTGGLKPLFEVRVERRTRLVSFEGASIEVTLDRGSIEAGRRSLPLCELELELKAGPVAALFRLCEQLNAVVPLRPGVRSKSERGYALRRGELGHVVKAEAVPLPPDASAADAFKAVARACLKHLRLNEARLLSHRDPDALHQTRVAVRRLRSALSMFKDVVSDDPSAAMRAGLKRISGPLGEARNFDVFLEGAVRSERRRRPEEPGLADLAAGARAERERAYDRVVAAIGSPEWGRFLVALFVWIEDGPWTRNPNPLSAGRREQPLRAFAAEALELRYRRVRKKGRHLARLEPAARHRVRIQAKKLRYAADFFAALYREHKGSRKRHEAFVAALARLQEGLGNLNDIASGHDLAASLAEKSAETTTSLAAGLLAADQDNRAERLLPAAARAHADLRAAKPFW